MSDGGTQGRYAVNLLDKYHVLWQASGVRVTNSIVRGSQADLHIRRRILIEKSATKLGARFEFSSIGSLGCFSLLPTVLIGLHPQVG
jgi:hypothetical protein